MALNHDNDRLYSLFMQAPAAIGVVMGPEHRFEFTNDRYLELLQKDDLVGKTVAETFPEVASQGFIGILDTVYESGEPFIGTEMPVDLYDDTAKSLVTHYYNFVYQPLKDSEGKVTGIMSHTLDVTEQVMLRQATKRREEEYLKLIDSIDQGFCVIDVIFEKDKPVDYLFIETNERFEKQTGLKDAVGKTIKTIAPNLEEIWYERYGKVAVSGESIRFEDNSEALGRWFDVSAIKIGSKEDRTVTVLFTDITERKKYEQQLQQTQQQLKAALETGLIGTWTVNTETNHVTASESLAKIFSMDPEKVTTGALSISVFLDAMHPKDRDRVVTAIERAIKTGEVLEIDYRVVADDKPTRWVMVRGQNEKKIAGSPMLFTGVLVDITQRKKAEARTLTLIEQRTKLLALNAAKDEFISLASHQLRTPASAVKQYIGMVLEGYTEELKPKQKEMLKLAWKSNERQLRIVSDLLKVAQVDAGKVSLEKESTDLVKLTQEVLEDQSLAFEERHQNLDFSHTRAEIFMVVDKNRLRMVLENLIDNASKYTEHGKDVSVKLCCHKGNVEIAVKDQGVGISENDMAKLFRKFQRLDNPLSVQVGGTGLGLYWVKKIIQLHKGRIEVQSAPGEGSTFTIILPM